MSKVDLERQWVVELVKSMRELAAAKGRERFLPPLAAAKRLGWTMAQMRMALACGGVTTTRRGKRLLVYVG